MDPVYLTSVRTSRRPVAIAEFGWSSVIDPRPAFRLSPASQATPCGYSRRSCGRGSRSSAGRTSHDGKSDNSAPSPVRRSSARDAEKTLPRVAITPDDGMDLGGGQVDILANIAGITRDTVIHKMTEKEWDFVIDVNLKGTFNMVQAVSAAMRDPAKAEELAQIFLDAILPVIDHADSYRNIVG